MSVDTLSRKSTYAFAIASVDAAMLTAVSERELGAAVAANRGVERVDRRGVSPSRHSQHAHDFVVIVCERAVHVRAGARRVDGGDKHRSGRRRGADLGWSGAERRQALSHGFIHEANAQAGGRPSQREAQIGIERRGRAHERARPGLSSLRGHAGAHARADMRLEKRVVELLERGGDGRGIRGGVERGFQVLVRLDSALADRRSPACVTPIDESLRNSACVSASASIEDAT